MDEREILLWPEEPGAVLLCSVSALEGIYLAAEVRKVRVEHDICVDNVAQR